MTGKAVALSGRALNGRNKEIWDKFIEGWTQTEIASEYGITQGRVSQILQVAAGEVKELPRDTQMRMRRAEVDSWISYWADKVLSARNEINRVQAGKELRAWFDFRARLNAEYAPSAVFHGGIDAQTLHYIIEGIPDKDIKGALG
jgi:hypothetical protein